MSEVEPKPKPEQNLSLRKLIDWATDGDNLNSAIDNVIAKIDSGELKADVLLSTNFFCQLKGSSD